MKREYQTREVKIDMNAFVEQKRQDGIDVNDPMVRDYWEEDYELKDGWEYSYYLSLHGYQDVDTFRIFPDGTCLHTWSHDSDESCGSIKGKLMKPYDELVNLLEDDKSIDEFLEWDHRTLEATVG